MKKIFLLPILCLFGFILNANPCALMQDDVEGYITHVCNGNDGAIDITVHNAIGPFEFCWLVYNNGDYERIPNGDTEDISNLSEGNYRVEIYDVTCAKAVLDFEVNKYKLDINFEIIHACEGSEGEIDLVLNTDQGPFNIVWSKLIENEDAQTIVEANNLNGTDGLEDVDNLGGGIYELKISNVGCKPLIFKIQILERDWNVYTTNVLTGCAGYYLVNKDYEDEYSFNAEIKNCDDLKLIVDWAELTNNYSWVFNEFPKQTNCELFQLDAKPSIFDTQYPGIYELRVADNNCEFIKQIEIYTDEVILSKIESVLENAKIDHGRCEKNGSISVFESLIDEFGPWHPYKFRCDWSSSTGMKFTNNKLWQDGLPKGEYCADLEIYADWNNRTCYRVNHCWEINGGYSLDQFIVSQTNISIDGCIGSIDLNGVNNESHSVTWHHDPDIVNPYNITDLIFGEYCMTLKYNGCSKDYCFQVGDINNNSILEVDVNISGSCFECPSGAIVLDPDLPNGQRTYNWGKNGNLNQLLNISAGRYCVEIFDKISKCKSYRCFNVPYVRCTNDNQIVVESILKPISCYGDLSCNGRIEVKSKYNIPVNFEWYQDGIKIDEDGPILDDLCIGQYEVRMNSGIDSDCIITKRFFNLEESYFNNNEPIVRVSKISQPTTCEIYGEKLYEKGEVFIEELINTEYEFEPIQYVWKDRLGIVISNEKNLVASPGIYFLEATSQGCSQNLDVEICCCDSGSDYNCYNSDYALEVKSEITNASMFGKNNGKIGLQINGGSYNYTISWTGFYYASENSLTQHSFNSYNKDLFNLYPGFYTVIVHDGCKEIKETFVIGPITYCQNKIRPIDFNISQTCVSGSIDQVKLTIYPFGGVAPYEIEWDDGSTINSYYANVNDKTKITVTDAEGCKRLKELRTKIPVEMLDFHNKEFTHTLKTYNPTNRTKPNNIKSLLETSYRGSRKANGCYFEDETYFITNDVDSEYTYFYYNPNESNDPCNGGGLLTALMYNFVDGRRYVVKSNTIEIPPGNFKIDQFDWENTLHQSGSTLWQDELRENRNYIFAAEDPEHLDYPYDICDEGTYCFFRSLDIFPDINLNYPILLSTCKSWSSQCVYNNTKDGYEEGPDCGGPACPACEHCNNGVLDGSLGEVLIDCGGPCPPCSHCDNWIQDEDETGIDCGGSYCPPCPVCNNDGIQNNGETGVDCGGGACPPCATCDDGKWNGDEEGVDCGGSNCPECPCSPACEFPYICDDSWCVEPPCDPPCDNEYGNYCIGGYCGKEVDCDFKIEIEKEVSHDTFTYNAHLINEFEKGQRLYISGSNKSADVYIRLTQNGQILVDWPGGGNGMTTNVPDKDRTFEILFDNTPIFLEMFPDPNTDMNQAYRATFMFRCTGRFSPGNCPDRFIDLNYNLISQEFEYFLVDSFNTLSFTRFKELNEEDITNIVLPIQEDLHTISADEDSNFYVISKLNDSWLYSKYSKLGQAIWSIILDGYELVSDPLIKNGNTVLVGNSNDNNSLDLIIIDKDGSVKVNDDWSIGMEELNSENLTLYLNATNSLAIHEKGITNTMTFYVDGQSKNITFSTNVNIKEVFFHENEYLLLGDVINNFQINNIEYSNYNYKSPLVISLNNDFNINNVVIDDNKFTTRLNGAAIDSNNKLLISNTEFISLDTIDNIIKYDSCTYVKEVYLNRCVCTSTDTLFYSKESCVISWQKKCNNYSYNLQKKENMSWVTINVDNDEYPIINSERDGIYRLIMMNENCDVLLSNIIETDCFNSCTCDAQNIYYDTDNCLLYHDYFNCMYDTATLQIKEENSWKDVSDIDFPIDLSELVVGLYRVLFQIEDCVHTPSQSFYNDCNSNCAFEIPNIFYNNDLCILEWNNNNQNNEIVILQEFINSWIDIGQVTSPYNASSGSKYRLKVFKESCNAYYSNSVNSTCICEDCTDCTQCPDCPQCEDCYACTDCTLCPQCPQCIEYCNTCTDCTQCPDCPDCQQDCTTCTDCTLCPDCPQCDQGCQDCSDCAECPDCPDCVTVCDTCTDCTQCPWCPDCENDCSICTDCNLCPECPDCEALCLDCDNCSECPWCPECQQGCGPYDADGDGVFDMCDNCPNVANFDQSDMDGNGVGDVCDCLSISSYSPAFINTNNDIINIEGNSPVNSDLKISFYYQDATNGSGWSLLTSPNYQTVAAGPFSVVYPLSGLYITDIGYKMTIECLSCPALCPEVEVLFNQQTIQNPSASSRFKNKSGNFTRNMIVFPNPSSKGFTVDLYVDFSTNGHIEVFNSSQNLVFKDNVLTNTGVNRYYLAESPNWPSGVYFIYYKSKDYVLSQRVIKIQ